jgi:hypothetical protein
MGAPNMRGVPMTEKKANAPVSDSPFERFKELTRKIVSVPKTEIDERQRAAKRKKARKKRRST